MASGFVYRPKGGRPPSSLPEGMRYLTRDEVGRVFSTGGGAALRKAYAHLYGKATGSGNLKWLRAKLTGGELDG